MMKPYIDKAASLVPAITKELAAIVTTPLELVDKELGPEKNLCGWFVGVREDMHGRFEIV